MWHRALMTALLLLATASLANAKAVGQRVNVNGMRMYYEVSGSGAPLVVLHGAYMNIPDMGAIIPQLARTHRVGRRCARTADATPRSGQLVEVCLHRYRREGRRYRIHRQQLE